MAASQDLWIKKFSAFLFLLFSFSQRVHAFLLFLCFVSSIRKKSSSFVCCCWFCFFLGHLSLCVTRLAPELFREMFCVCTFANL